MSKNQSEKEKHGNGSYHFQDNFIEGTSARTRALSFEEIMSRRKNKKLHEEVKRKPPLSEVHCRKLESQIVVPSLFSDDKNKLKDSKYTMGDYKTKEEAMADKKNSSRHKKGRRDHDLEDNTMSKSTIDKSGREKELRKEKHGYYRSTIDGRLKDNAGKGSSKKPLKSYETRHKPDSEDEKFLRDNKRKGFNGSDQSRRGKDVFASENRESSKLQYIEPLERRKIQRYDEPKSKRRRSRSREYDQDRDRHSVSVSPRAHKRSFHGRDYGESSSHSLKERSGRRHSDADKYRASGNNGYESGRYRHHGSGLGGYSPRKRRTDAAVIKMSSPTNRSPDRKGATWDLPPSDINQSSHVPSPSNKKLSNQNVHDQPTAKLDFPNKGNSQMTLSTASIAQAISFASIDSVHLTQATRPMRRLYIENLPASSTDKSIIGCLNDFLLSAGTNRIPGTQPCISCIINKEKNQAVVEFLTPEDATAALSFDGKTFSGYILKLRRPKDFIDAAPTVFRQLIFSCRLEPKRSLQPLLIQ